MSEKDESVHGKNQMSSDILSIKYRRELNLLSLEAERHSVFDKKSLAISLFEWYEFKGRKLPYEKNGKKLNEIPKEELEFLHGILRELPTDFPMIRYSALWSKWLFPNVNIRNSSEYFNFWLDIMKIMEERFTTVYINDLDSLVKLLCGCLDSSSPDEFELCYVLLKILRKLVTMYIPPRKAFAIISGGLLECLRSFYIKENLKNDFFFEIKEEITQIVQISVSDKHLNSFQSILRNEVLALTGSTKQHSSTKQSSSSNYTIDFYKVLIGKDAKFDCFIPLIIKKIHQVERSHFKETQSSSHIGGDYLLFFLYLSLNLESQDDFYEKIQYVNECFNFFIQVNTFNIRQSDDDFGNNFKFRIFELILTKLKESISKSTINPFVWKTLENSIIIDPVKSLDLLTNIFFSGNHKKPNIPKSTQICQKSYIYGPLETILSFISGENVQTKKSDISSSETFTSSSLTLCISKYLLTFMKLHDLPLFFSKLSEILSCHIQSKEIHKFQQVFLSTQVLQTIRDYVSFSVLPGQATDILDSFIGLVKSNSSSSLLYETISNTWIAVLMITIPLSESSIPSLEEAVKLIHQYIKESQIKQSFPEDSKIFQLTCNLGLINLLRKLLSWNIQQKSELVEMLNYHYDQILTQDYQQPDLHPKNSSYSSIHLYSNLLYLITFITKLRDSGSLIRKDFLKILVLYRQIILDDSQALEINDPICKVHLNQILINFIIHNITNLNGINHCIEDYVNQKDKSSHFYLFLTSLYQQYIQSNQVSNSLFRSLSQIPYLTGLMIDLSLEDLDSLLKTNHRKKRKLNSGDLSHELQVLDFWNRKDVITYLINNHKTGFILEDVFSNISRLYLELVFEMDYVSSSNGNQLALIHLLEEAIEGIKRWITLEAEIGAHDFLIRFSRVLFDTKNDKKGSNRLTKYLELVSRVDTSTQLSRNLIDILKKSIRVYSEIQENAKKAVDLIITEMESLDWFWWINITDNFEDSLFQNKSWLGQIQLCIDLSSVIGFELIKDKIVGKINIFQVLRNLKHKLKSNKEIELIHSAKISELYLMVEPEIQGWKFELDEKHHETQGNCPFSILITIVCILLGILKKVQQVLEDPEKERKLLKQGFILIDLVVSYLKQVIEIVGSILLDLKKNQEKMKLHFKSLQELYSEIFNLFLELIRVNLEFGIYRTNEENQDLKNFGNQSKNVSEWSRYMVKCILEGSSIKKEDYSHSRDIYRQMEIYEMISKLVNSSVTSLLNYGINETMGKVHFTREDNLFRLLSYLDLFWGIIQNKGHIYRSLSPCLKGSLFSKISSWGASNKLEFTIEVIMSKLMDSIEKKNSDGREEYILCTFSLIRLSNMISILYSCCIGCYISEVKDNSRLGLNNSRIVPISNMLLIISSRLSSIGLGLRNENLERMIRKDMMDNHTRESFYLSLFECLMISPYIPLYTLLNPLWDQSNRKNNKENSTTGHLDVWISQFHLIEEALKNLVNLGDQISLNPIGLRLFTSHNKRISRLYPLIVSQITKNKVQRYSISLASDLINYINILNKRLELIEENNEEKRDSINLNIQIVKSSCLNPILSVIDNHCKQSLFTMLKDEQRIIFKQINKKNSEMLSFSKLEG